MNGHPDPMDARRRQVHVRRSGSAASAIVASASATTLQATVDDLWRLPVLMYRSVPHHSPRTAAPHSTPVVQLEEQLDSLVAGGWQLAGLTEALSSLGEDPDRRMVALTFEDGLLDFLNAFEILCQFRVRATLYVPTRDVGMRVSRWDKGQSRLSWEHLVEIAGLSIEIGSQSVSGRPLDVGARAWVEDELRESKRELEDRLGVPVDSFCYPRGYSSARIRRMVAEAGYSNACVIDSRVATSADDRFALPRIRIESGITGRDVLQLAVGGERGIVPHLNRVAAPAWRMTRRSVFRIMRATAVLR